MGKLLPFAPTDEALVAAWEAYAAAARHAAAIEAEGATSRQRMLAHLEANRLHRTFCRLGDRYDAAQRGA